MDTSRVSTGQLVAGASGLALFLFLFLDWYGAGGQARSAWEAFSVVDVALAAIGLGVAALTALALTGSGAAPGRVLLLGGVAALLLSLSFLLELSHGELGSEVSIKVGGYLSLLASIGIAAGGVMSEQEPVARPRPTTPPPSAPPPGGTPPPSP